VKIKCASVSNKIPVEERIKSAVNEENLLRIAGKSLYKISNSFKFYLWTRFFSWRVPPLCTHGTSMLKHPTEKYTSSALVYNSLSADPLLPVFPLTAISSVSKISVAPPGIFGGDPRSP
jgi:hypothetical protein